MTHTYKLGLFTTIIVLSTSMATAAPSNTLIVSGKSGRTSIAMSPMTNKWGMKFVYIKPGSFMMGSPSTEVGRFESEIQHQVTLTKGFYMQTTEVTQGQWQAVMGLTMKQQRAKGNPAWPLNGEGTNHPVYYVNWDEVQAFIAKLNQQGQGTYHLPTEAEWEYAARAGTSGPFGIGDGHNLDASQANFDGNSPYGNGKKGTVRLTTMPVASFRPNAWGLYDMHGNVWEWVQDWYGDYPRGAVTDPQGPASGKERGVRSGSWGYRSLECRSAHRGVPGPSTRNGYLGFRVVKSAP